MTMRLPISRALAACLLFAAASCFGTPPPNSGLLGDLSDFDRRDEDTWVHWAAEPDELESYERMRLDRISVMLPEGTELSPSQQRELRQVFQRALEEELELEFITGELRTEGTIALRVLIVDVQGDGGGEGVPDLGSVTIEFELLDAVTGDRLFAAILRRYAREVSATPEARRAEAEHAFGEWARELHDWVEQYLGD